MDKTAIIVFNSGGWGSTPLEKARDFSPIIGGIQKVIAGLGYSSVIIQYQRTKKTFWGRIGGLEDLICRFSFSSEKFAKYLGELADRFPGAKILLAGFSSGGAFVIETYKKLPGRVKQSVYVAAVGAPFWAKIEKSDNVLQLNNNGADQLANRNVRAVFFAIIFIPFRWLFAKFKGWDWLRYRSFFIPGHDYSWESPEVGLKIIAFLEDKFSQPDSKG